MSPNILENISTWLVDWSLVTIMGNSRVRARDGDIRKRTTASPQRSPETQIDHSQMAFVAGRHVALA
jgi:hypothetical protein